MSEDLPVLPDEFRQTALAFPNVVKVAIAQIDTPELAADNLAKAEAMAGYAARIKSTSEEVNSIQYGKLLLAAKVGELSPPRKRGPKTEGDNHPPGEKLFHANTLTDYRKLAKHQRAGKIDAYWGEVDSGGHESEISIAGFMRFAGGGIRGCLTGEIEWYTPSEYIEAARLVMGSIDLDPASCDFAQETVQAKKFYTKDDDGLEEPWWGNVWLNPPYKAKVVDAFVEKLCGELEAEAVKQAILLTNNATDTQWWHRAAENASAVCFTEGRISFENSGGAKKNPPNGQTFCYFGGRVKTFAKHFGEFGIVLPVPKQIKTEAPTA